MATIANNKIYIAGLTESSSLITGGDRDGLLLTLDFDGNVIEYFTWGDDAMNSFHDLAVQGSNIYLTGESVANNQESGFLLAFTDVTVSTFEPEVQVNIQVYPNPSQGNIIIEGNENLLGTELNIFDQLGRLVAKERIQSERMETYLKQGGIYYVNIQSEDFMLTRKVVVVK